MFANLSLLLKVNLLHNLKNLCFGFYHFSGSLAHYVIDLKLMMPLDFTPILIS